MTTKKPTRPVAKPPAKPKLQNLAARPTNFEDTVDDAMMVDNSGVFRVTAALQQAQTGHDEEQGMRFANESLVIRAQRDNFRDTVEEPLEEQVTEDEATVAMKRQRLATLTARNQARSRRR